MKQILYFRANWCNQCKITTPIVDKLVNEGYNIETIDVGKEPETANKYMVMSLPNFIVLEGKRVVDQHAKVLNELQIKELL